MMTLGISWVSKGNLLPAANNESKATANPFAVGSPRDCDFRKISTALGATVQAVSSQAVLAQGDSLELVRRLPDHSVSLILTDPPYHATKKSNIYGDTAFREDQHYLDWMAEYAAEWKRILRPNGSLFCFCASEMAARLEIMFSTDFNILSQVVWMSRPE